MTPFAFNWLELVGQVQPRVLGGFRWPILAGAIALAVSWYLTPWIRALAIKKGAVDDPNRDDRRIHREPLPRWGGLGMYGGLLVSLAVVLPFAFPGPEPFPRYLIAIMLVGAVLVVFGALDDLYDFSAKLQAFVLLACGVAVQFAFDNFGRVQIQSLGIPLSNGHGVIHLGAWAIPMTAIYIFVITKTMDTIDGVDGLAASIATVAATTLTIIAAYGGQPRVAIAAAAIAGACLGFFKHNYNPAKIIMGTGGSQLLGFVLGCLTIVGAFKTAAAVALFIPILVFGVPISDAVVVVIRRILSGQPITQGDKRHFHHRLLEKGLSQRQTVFVLAVAAAALCAALLVVIKFYG